MTQPLPMGHEYVGIVEEVGSEVKTIKPGQFVVGSFVISDNTRPICRAGYQSRCLNYEFVAQTIGTQARFARIPLADDPGWMSTRMGGPGAPDDLRLGHLTQGWLATSEDPDARTSGGY